MSLTYTYLPLCSVFEAVMLGMVASTYDVEAVLMAVGTTAGVTLALTIFAFQTKIDFTGCGGEKIDHSSFSVIFK